jgi:hypothetical protein
MDHEVTTIESGHMFTSVVGGEGNDAKHPLRSLLLTVRSPPCGPPLLGCLLAWTSVLAPCFLFSPVQFDAFFL